MHSLVSPQVGNLDKTLAADPALEWLLTSVQSDVCLKVVIPGEPLLTMGTCIWLLPCMGANVVHEHVFVVKCRFTEFTWEPLWDEVSRVCRVSTDSGSFFAFGAFGGGWCLKRG